MTAALATVLLGAVGAASAKEVGTQFSAQTEVELSALPRQAQETHRLILAGGPFPEAKDGVVFGNYERLLPRRARGFYHEYTVRTPGVRHRGARRMVCGGELRQRPEVCYYTDDHYASFRRIRATAH